MFRLTEAIKQVICTANLQRRCLLAVKSYADTERLMPELVILVLAGHVN
jgi:hypothetical protein